MAHFSRGAVVGRQQFRARTSPHAPHATQNGPIIIDTVVRLVWKFRQSAHSSCMRACCARVRTSFLRQIIFRARRSFSVVSNDDSSGALSLHSAWQKAINTLQILHHLAAAMNGWQPKRLNRAGKKAAAKQFIYIGFNTNVFDLLVSGTRAQISAYTLNRLVLG